MIKSIRYERLYNLGNFEHEKICLEVDVMDGDDPVQVLAKARTFCDLHSHSGEARYARAKAVLADTENPHLQSDIKSCMEIVEKYENEKDMPF